MFNLLERNDSQCEWIAHRILNHTKKEVDFDVYDANAYTVLGILNKNRGYFNSAVVCHLKALKIAENLKDENRIGVSLTNIGTIYQVQRKFLKAVRCYHRALRVLKKNSRADQESICFFNLGECYKELEQYDNALVYFNTSLLIEKKIKNQSGILFAYFGIVDTYLRLNRLQEANIFLNAINFKLSPILKEENIIYLHLKGKYLLATGNLTSAESYLEKARVLAVKDAYTYQLIRILELLIDLRKKRSETESVIVLYEELFTIKEKLKREEDAQQLDDFEARNELVKGQLTIDALKNQQKSLNEISEKRKQIINFSERLSLFFFVLAAVILLLVYYVNKTKSK